LSIVENNSIFNLEVVIIDIKETFNSEGNYLYYTDTEMRRYGYRRGLDTPVVHTVNDEYSLLN